MLNAYFHLHKNFCFYFHTNIASELFEPCLRICTYFEVGQLEMFGVAHPSSISPQVFHLTMKGNQVNFNYG